MSDSVLRDLKVSETLFQVIAAKYFTEFLPQRVVRFRYLQLVNPSQI